MKLYSKPQYKLKLTPIQQQFILGGLLGDLSIPKPRSVTRNCHLSVTHSSKQAEYVRWKYSILREFVRTPPKRQRNKGWGKENIRFHTLAHPAFTEIYSLCYKNGRKTITREWLSKINHPIALAVWYMDDGSLHHNKSMTISTHNFSLEEQRLLQSWLKKEWHISPRIKADPRKKKYYYLKFPASERDKFFKIIEPYVIPSMKHKLLPQVEQVTCAVCGKNFVPKRNTWAMAKRRKANLYCSPECAKKGHLRLYYNPKPIRCAVCGKEFTPHVGRKITCSPKCARIHYLEWKKAYRKGKTKPLEKKTCVICGRIFRQKRTYQKTCSPECSKIYHSKKGNCCL
jgi:hypothetical protein